MSQVFNNMFIETMDDVKAQIANGNYTDALLAISTLQSNITLEDWLPFPDYKKVLQKMNLSEEIDQIQFILVRKLNNPAMNLDERFNESINRLTAYAHMLNFIECSYSNPEITKLAIIISSASMFGIPLQVSQMTSNCGDQTNYVERKNLTTPQQSRTEEYVNILYLFQDSVADDKLRMFLLNSFSKLEESPTASFENLSIEEPNLFIKGYMENVFELFKKYKQEYQELKNQPEQELSEMPPEIFELLTSSLNTMSL